MIVLAKQYGIPPWQFEDECTAEWWERMVVFEDKLEGERRSGKKQT